MPSLRVRGKVIERLRQQGIDMAVLMAGPFDDLIPSKPAAQPHRRRFRGFDPEV